MSTHDEHTNTERRELFLQVALTQLTTRKAGVTRGTADGLIVCPQFLADVALITETLLNSASEFQTRIRAKTKEQIDEIVENHAELIRNLVDTKTEE